METWVDSTLASMKGENLEEWQYWRGQALLGLGRAEEARQAFERCLHFQPGFKAARVALQNLGSP